MKTSRPPEHPSTAGEAHEQPAGAAGGFPIVGIGASAGGLAAFEAFLNGTLQLLEPASPRGQRMPIDFFFRSLAQDQHERAIGVVLSGTGSDGTLGIRAIKGEGGMVMAQNPESTEYDGMPRSALATGLVDDEVEALFRDMLIGVTSFFRDPEVFAAIEAQVIPGLFAGKPADAAIRVWVAGCSSGEEAYSLAILLAERQEALKKSYKVQVFATDIDSRAIAAARAGIFPASIAADLTPERLARFFSREPGDNAYRIHKGIRDLLIFSEQDVLKDAPSSKLDLISCRNLLIYLNADLHKRLIPLFHHALKPNGFLILGTSETVGESDDFFAALERKHKIYQRKEDLLGSQRAEMRRFLPTVTAIDVALPRAARNTDYPRKLPLRELAEQALLQQIIQAGALVNVGGDILYLHGRTGMHLEPALGESCLSNILKMAREGRRHGLTTAVVQTRELLHKANDHRLAERGRPGVRDCHHRASGCAVRVSPVRQPATGLSI